MKNALILHGTNGKFQHNWFPWMKKKLESEGWRVWAPDLPGADRPSIVRYNKFLLKENDWDFNEDSILIGHSSGSVAVMGLLEALPDDVRVDTCYLVSAFKNDLGWDALSELFERPLDYELIKSKAKRFVLIHSDDDPYCPLDHAEYLAEKLGAKLIVKKGQKHFNISTVGEKYKKFPFLLELIMDSE